MVQRQRAVGMGDRSSRHGGLVAVLRPLGRQPVQLGGGQAAQAPPDDPLPRSAPGQPQSVRRRHDRSSRTANPSSSHVAGSSARTSSSRTAPPRRGRGDAAARRPRLVEHVGQALGDRRPGVALAGVVVGGRAAPAPLVAVIDGLDQRVGQRSPRRRARRASRSRRRRRSRRGRSGRRAIAGRPQAIPSTSTAPNCSRTDGSTTTSEAARKSGSSSWRASRPGRRRARRWPRSSPAGCSPSHSPGWPPTITSEARRSKRSLRGRPGPDQQPDPLDGGEAARRNSTTVPCGDACGLAGACSRSPPPRCPAPSRAAPRQRRWRQWLGAVDVVAVEALGVEAVGQHGAAVGVDRRAAAPPGRAALGREQDDAWLLRAQRAHPARPRLGVRPASAGAPSAIASSISSSVPCRWVTTGTCGRDARGRLVQRREVVQVQHVGIGGARRLERAAQASTWCS